MCSKLFVREAGVKAGDEPARDRLAATYETWLRRTLRHKTAVLIATAVVSGAALLLGASLPSEYAPTEDRGVFSVLLEGPEGATFEYTDRQAAEMESILMREVEDGPVMRFLTRVPGSWGSISEVNSVRAIVLLDPWGERKETAQAFASRLRAQLATIPGVRAFVFMPRSLGIRGDGRPVELVIGGPDYESLEEWRDIMLAAMDGMPSLLGPDSDYEAAKPQMEVRIDRDRAATLGVSLLAVGRTLETMLGGRTVTTFVDRGREYDVILQGREADRATPDDLRSLYVRSDVTGRLIPLSNLVHLEETAGPTTLNRFDRMRAITLQAALADGASLGEALDEVEDAARELLPASARIGWDGESLEFRESGSSLFLTFGLAMVIVFLVLAAQFESFVHAAIILVTVPLALTGAWVGLWLMGGSVNVFTQIGAILLIGLSAKNGVLIVEFANQLRDRGLEIGEALVQASRARLRPILMTSACTTFGALPLLFASGAGSETRQPIGIVVVFGVTISAVLTLFVVPALYGVLARFTRSPEAVAREIHALRGGEAEPGLS
jgi:multidrug efflux pump